MLCPTELLAYGRGFTGRASCEIIRWRGRSYQAETHHNRKRRRRRRKCETFRMADEAGAHAKRLAGEISREFVGGSGTGLQEGANYGAWHKPGRLHRRVQVVVVAPITGTGSAWWASSPLPQGRLLTH